MTGEDILRVKELLEKADTIKRFKYSSLGKELKAQTDTDQHQYNFLKVQNIMLLITIEKMVIIEKRIGVEKVISLKSLTHY